MARTKNTNRGTIMMDTVRIDRVTIRRNPNAGMMATCIAGGTISSFEYFGEYLPDIFKNIFIVTDSKNNYYRGELKRALTTSELNDLQKIGNSKDRLVIHEERPSQWFDHPPDPEWLFGYEDTAVTCSSCGGTVRISEIEIHDDCGDDWESESKGISQCPLCRNLNTFNFTYEDIGDVVDK